MSFNPETKLRLINEFEEANRLTNSISLYNHCKIESPDNINECASKYKDELDRIKKISDKTYEKLIPHMISGDNKKMGEKYNKFVKKQCLNKPTGTFLDIYTDTRNETYDQCVERKSIKIEFM